MRELPVYKVTIHIDAVGDWIRFFVGGRPIVAEILTVLVEDQGSLAAESKFKWEQFDHWITLIRDFSLPTTAAVNKVCTYAGSPVGIIKIEEREPAITTDTLE